MTSGVWKLQDAKARFSELVREARKGNPQRVSVHGKEAVLVVDPERFEVRAREKSNQTLAGFVERSKKYRAKSAAEDVEFDTRYETLIGARPSPFDDIEGDKD